MKAITPVIALVMLLLITVGVVGISSVWFSGILSASTKNSISIPPGGVYCSGADLNVYILNNGDSTITASDIIVAQVDGVSVLNTPFFGDMRSALAGYWKFDEVSGSTAADSSGNGNTGNLKPLCPDCPNRVVGKSRNALKFDGDNDYVSVGNPASLQLVNDFTVMMWLNLDASQPSSFYDTISHGHDSTRGWVWQGSAATLGALFGDGSPTTGPDFSKDLRGAGWHHLVATKGSVGSVAPGVVLYLDGKPDNSMPIKTAPAVLIGADLEIGRDNNFDREAKGLIDEVKIYNKVVGDINIQPGKAGLVINYPGIEGRHIVRVGTSSNILESSLTCS